MSAIISGRVRSVCSGQGAVSNATAHHKEEKENTFKKKWRKYQIPVLGFTGSLRCLPWKNRIAPTLLYERVCDPVESLPLCCVSSDPQMLPSTHDSSQIALLSLVLIREITARPREDDPDVLQDVQPRTSITDDSFLCFPSHTAFNCVTWPFALPVCPLQITKCLFFFHYFCMRKLNEHTCVITVLFSAFHSYSDSCDRPTNESNLSPHTTCCQGII